MKLQHGYVAYTFQVLRKLLQCNAQALCSIQYVEHLHRKCFSYYCADSQKKILQIHGSTRATVILTGKEKHGDYLEVLILSDQLLPGKNLISLDAFKAVLSLFILKNKALQLTSALSLNALLTTQQAINDQWKLRDNGLFREHGFQ